jgi:RNA polymerase sigma-70 factor (ECF subfamily)
MDGLNSEGTGVVWWTRPIRSRSALSRRGDRRAVAGGGELPKETRRVVTLCDLKGLTYEAAAAQLGIPLGTVRSRLSRGRQVLREKVGQLDFA